MTGWHHLPEELITRIADFLPLKSKLNLATCAKREQRSVANSKLFIRSICVELNEDCHGVEVEEMDGTVTAAIARSPDGTREAYLEVLALLNMALKFSKDPIEEFSFSGELVTYGEIFRIRKLISAPKITFFCDDNQWKFWTRLIPYGSVEELVLESTENNDFSELELEFVPCFKWLRKLTLNHFSMVDFNKFKRFEKIEEIRLNSWFSFKYLDKFMTRWCDSKIADSFRLLSITDGEFWNQMTPLRTVLRKQMRAVQIVEDPTPCETYVVRRERDGAVADLEIGTNFLRFSFDPEKYERVYCWPAGSDEEGAVVVPVRKRSSEEAISSLSIS